MTEPRDLECAFCTSRGPLTREHVWPQWLAEVIDRKQPVMARAGGGVEYREWKTRPLQHVVQRVCAACNSGWMSRLETAAKPLLLSMIRGEARTYSRDEHWVMARWAAKTVAVGDLATGRPALKAFARRQLCADGFPADASLVVARYAGGRFPTSVARWTAPRSVRVGERVDQRTVGLFTVSVESVVFQMLVHGVVGAEDVRPVNEKADYAHVVWPFGSSLVWPLPTPLGDDGLRVFANEL